MLDEMRAVGLRCSNCGANLEISPEAGPGPSNNDPPTRLDPE